MPSLSHSLKSQQSLDFTQNDHVKSLYLMKMTTSKKLLEKIATSIILASQEKLQSVLQRAKRTDRMVIRAIQTDQNVIWFFLKDLTWLRAHSS